MAVSIEKRGEQFSARVTPQFKEMLRTLTEQVSEALGARVSQAQALEVAVREAVAARSARKKARA